MTIYSVKNSEWTTPLVAVPKHDGKSVRLCRDFKITLRRASRNEYYALPTPEDNFAKLSDRKLFYITNAYLELSIGHKLQSLLTINTHKGLFSFKSLPYAITTAPFQFQAAMK